MYFYQDHVPTHRKRSPASKSGVPAGTGCATREGCDHTPLLDIWCCLPRRPPAKSTWIHFRRGPPSYNAFFFIQRAAQARTVVWVLYAAMVMRGLRAHSSSSKRVTFEPACENEGVYNMDVFFCNLGWNKALVPDQGRCNCPRLSTPPMAEACLLRRQGQE